MAGVRAASVCALIDTDYSRALRSFAVAVAALSAADADAVAAHIVLCLCVSSSYVVSNKLPSCTPFAPFSQMPIAHDRTQCNKYTHAHMPHM